MNKIIIFSVFLTLASFYLQAQPGILTMILMPTEVNDCNRIGDDVGTSVIVQPDGMIILAGYAHTSTAMDGAFVRYYPDGSVDNSFGTDGIVLIDIALMNDYITTIHLQDDGKIIAGGATTTINDNDFLIIRLNTDGSPDISFRF